MNSLTIQFESNEIESVQLSFDDFKNLPADSIIKDVSEFDDRRIGSGIRLSELFRLNADWPTPSKFTFLATEDDYDYPVKADAILDRGILIFSIENQPLKKEQGGPFRLTVPGTLVCGTDPKAGLDNCANVKFIDKIVVTC